MSGIGVDLRQTVLIAAASENAGDAITRAAPRVVAEQRPRDLLDLRVDAGVDLADIRLDAAAAAGDARIGDERDVVARRSWPARAATALW